MVKVPSLTDGLHGVTEQWLARYDLNIPRYTSYPTAPTWTEDFGPPQWQQQLALTQGPLSVYTHLPFCEHRCVFCGCNVVITQQREQAEKYLDYLFKDIDRVVQQLPPHPQPVVQYHWGGGTPTYLNSEQLTRVFKHHQGVFNFDPQAEISLEVDPRVTTEEQLQVLRELGFNRISLGVQDFDVQVQKAVERLQSETQTWAIFSEARRLGFTGINMDLIYGLPHQTIEGFDATLDTVIAMAPDRLAVYNFAYLPKKLPHQSVLDPATLPTGPEKFALFVHTVTRLTEAGYVYIGMDHFAKPSDELALALANRTLHRNFMGYTTHAGSDLLGFGVSAISGLHGAYQQNHHKLSRYYQAVDADELPTSRGLVLTDDDKNRRQWIMTLLCQGQLPLAPLQGLPNAEAITQALEGFATDGLLTLTPQALVLTPLGRVFSRVVAAQLDSYLPNQQSVFSRSL
jgi:oxygen-independent coproporphyrinogen III oxidase